MKMKILLGLPLCAVLLSSCATNGYQQYYRGNLGGKSVADIKHLEPNDGEPILYTGKDPESDSRRMWEDGYVMVGQSSFEGKLQDTENAKAQARNIKASVVIVYGKYSKTVSGSIPYTVQNPSQMATTTSSGNIYGSGGGSASYSGTSTTIVPGGYTTHNIPYSVDRYNQNATYWVKDLRRGIIGIKPRDLTYEEKKALGSNKGLAVVAIKKGSPAYKSDLLTGDIIVSCDGEAIWDYKSFRIDRFAGKEVTLEIVRDGTRLYKKVLLNEKDTRFD